MQTKTTSLARGSLLLAGSCALLFSAAALAGGHTGGSSAPGADGFVGPAPDSFYWRHGFEGRLDEFTKVLMDAIEKAGPTDGAGLDLSPEQQAMLGRSVARVIKTIRNDVPYQHEANDALIKATLTTIQFAKDLGKMEELIEHDVKTQTPMIARVGRMVQEGANPELAMIALTERTACFYQLVELYERDGMTMRWKSPYGNVLAVSTPMGQHDFSEQWVHENYTVPMLTRQAAIMGMELEISPWQADGWLTMTMKVPQQAAAAVN